MVFKIWESLDRSFLFAFILVSMLLGDMEWFCPRCLTPLIDPICSVLKLCSNTETTTAQNQRYFRHELCIFTILTSVLDFLLSVRPPCGNLRAGAFYIYLHITQINRNINLRDITRHRDRIKPWDNPETRYHAQCKPNLRKALEGNIVKRFNIWCFFAVRLSKENNSRVWYHLYIYICIRMKKKKSLEKKK